MDPAINRLCSDAELRAAVAADANLSPAGRALPLEVVDTSMPTAEQARAALPIALRELWRCHGGRELPDSAEIGRLRAQHGREAGVAIVRARFNALVFGAEASA